MKRTLALILCCILILPGCAQQSSPEGIWQAKLDLTSEATAALEQTPLEDYKDCFQITDFPVEVVLALNASGSFSLHLDTASVFRQIRRLISVAEPKILRIQAQEETTREQTTEPSLESLEKELELAFQTYFYPELEKQIEKMGRYQIQENRIYFYATDSQPDTGIYEQFNLSGKKLILTARQGQEEDGLALPLTGYPLSFRKIA